LFQRPTSNAQHRTSNAQHPTNTNQGPVGGTTSSASAAHETVSGEAVPEKSAVRRAGGQRDAVPPVV